MHCQIRHLLLQQTVSLLRKLHQELIEGMLASSIVPLSEMLPEFDGPLTVQHMKKDSPIHGFVALRACVGFLGQNFKWWPCKFAGPTGIQMLQTIFPRTAHQAALRSVMHAAALHHDKALGKRGVNHLFRLPATLEERIGKLMHGFQPNDWSSLTFASPQQAFDTLKTLGSSQQQIQVAAGPVQVGTIGRVLTRQSVEELAIHYHAAFTQNVQCLPYFGGKMNAR